MRTVISHFDGDPFTLGAWLCLYEKNWRGECDKVLISIAYKKDLVSQEVIECEKRLLAKYPEIEVVWKNHWATPEDANAELIKMVETGSIGLIESDGLIFKRGLVEYWFDLIESYNVVTIVAPDYHIIPEPLVKIIHCNGYMRCFFFTSKKVLDQVDLNFNPVSIGGYDADCFGWISYQLATLVLFSHSIPDGFIRPGEESWKDIKENGYCHIRQMTSSALGMGGGNYGLWKDVKPEDLAIGPGMNGDFTYTKAVIFKEFFLENFLDPNLPIGFINEYRNVLESVVQNYHLDRIEIENKKALLKGLL